MGICILRFMRPRTISLPVQTRHIPLSWLWLQWQNSRPSKSRPIHSLPFHITGWHVTIGFRSSRYAPSPPWRAPPSPSLLRVNTAQLVSGLPDKDLARHVKRLLPLHFTGRHGTIGFRSSRYASGPSWRTPSPLLPYYGSAWHRPNHYE